ncbi:serum response factor-binding protein 1 [Orussus abietinus]|uniref:serum response factor-binding protein 1 n=1 Tax=Orussus abietinus TaxID=222816 RepID=UPI00062580C8|nr:serum response factor-binding protein 1 [Orussus abietinus]
MVTSNGKQVWLHNGADITCTLQSTGGPRGSSDMSKLEINNEIVLMRHAVRRARVHVVRKLVRDVKTLREKKGNEKQQEKYKRKAERFANEILAIKKVKDDEISRYAITNSRSLQEILEDQGSDSQTRMMARLAFHSTLKNVVSKFKEKFPEYEKHLGPGKRKLIKLQRKAKKQAAAQKRVSKNVNNENIEVADNSEKDTSENNEIITNRSSNIEYEEASKDQDIKETLSSDEDSKTLEPGSILRIKPININNESKDSERKKLKKSNKESTKNPEVKSLEVKNHPRKTSVPVKVTKEAMVKRFTELLQEETSNEDFKEKDDTVKPLQVELRKEVDAFFMTGDGEREYLSVAIPKEVKSSDDYNNQDNFKNPKFAKSKFFDKIDNSNGWNQKPSRTQARQKNYCKSNDNYVSQRAERPINGSRSSKVPFKRKEDVPEHLHPSWAAKKKQQEILKQGFQGKKIVFGDD